MLRLRRLAFLGALSCIAFLVINGISYFVRSDGYGVTKWEDGIVQVGFPFLIFEEGGFDYRRHFSLQAVFGNLLVTTSTVFVIFACTALLARSESNEE
jgi:apolipoprotein N-acyltransferase